MRSELGSPRSRGVATVGASIRGKHTLGIARFVFAAHELGRIGNTRVRPTRMRALEQRHEELSDGDKRLLIVALSRMPHRDEVPVLVEMLRGRSRRVRTAAGVLAEIGARERRGAVRSAKATTILATTTGTRALRRHPEYRARER